VPRLLERGDEILQRPRAARVDLGDLRRIAVVRDARVAAFLETPDHVAAHPAESDHSELHPGLLI
jgi:hypothetical protein